MKFTICTLLASGNHFHPTYCHFPPCLLFPAAFILDLQLYEGSANKQEHDSTCLYLLFQMSCSWSSSPKLTPRPIWPLSHAPIAHSTINLSHTSLNATQHIVMDQPWYMLFDMACTRPRRKPCRLGQMSTRTCPQSLHQTSVL